ncbi:MAG: hypothetical protein J6Z36_03505, partial [Clostridia bacterium]|nr:hypothetical protein [Clostridia bacterium]
MKKFDLPQEEKKVRIRWTIGIIAFDVVWFGLVLLFEFFLLKMFPQMEFGPIITIMVVLVIIVVVPSIVGRNLIIETFSKYYRQQKKAWKEKVAILDAEERKKSDEIRQKYNLPNDILTAYEAVKLHSNEFLGKREWAVCIVCEICALALTIGLAFYGEFVGVLGCILLPLVGVAFLAYGFCFLCKAY